MQHLFANLRKQFYDENIGQYEEIMRTNHEQVQAKKRIKLMQGLGFFPAAFFDSIFILQICFLIQDLNQFDLTWHWLFINAWQNSADSDLT